MMLRQSPKHQFRNIRGRGITGPTVSAELTIPVSTMRFSPRTGFSSEVKNPPEVILHYITTKTHDCKQFEVFLCVKISK